MNLTGRPTVMTDEVKSRIIEALRGGNTRTASASAGPCAFNTFLSSLQRDPEFAAACQEAEDEAERVAVGVVRAAMLETWQAGAWWLERRKPQNYGKQERLTLLRDVAKDCEKLSDEELAALAYGAPEGEAGTE